MKFPLIAVLFSVVVSIAPISAFADVSISVNIAPPELPVYEQPELPGDGYIWTPGYWAYSDDGYFWVPGTWVMPPQVGYLWTPGYWYWSESAFVFHAGYWGQHVGYYGGVNYGYGYSGHDYQGGRWDNGHFNYNTTVNHINVTNIHNTYNETVVVNNSARTSYNGGTGGLNVKPNAQEISREHEAHVNATPEQIHHEQGARAKPELRQSANHGNPPIGATSKPSAFENHGAAAEKGKDDAHPENNQHTEDAPHNNVAKPQEHAPAMAEPKPNVNADRARDRARAPAAHNNPTPQVKSAPRPEQQHAARAPQQQQPKPPQEHPQQQHPAQPHEQHAQAKPPQEHHQEEERH